MLAMALSLFIVSNPLGQAPLFLSLVKDFDLKRQKYILAREVLISYCIAVFFVFLGEFFLDTLAIQPHSVSICGGVVLFLVALGLIFPRQEVGDEQGPKILKEPFVVPIATPLLSGPCLLTTIIFHSAQADATALVGAITLAWGGTALVFWVTPYLKFILGRSGMTALEQLMGMLLCMLSTKMFLTGLSDLIQSMS